MYIIINKRSKTVITLTRCRKGGLQKIDQYQQPNLNDPVQISERPERINKNI